MYVGVLNQSGSLNHIAIVLPVLSLCIMYVCRRYATIPISQNQLSLNFLIRYVCGFFSFVGLCIVYVCVFFYLFFFIILLPFINYLTIANTSIFQFSSSSSYGLHEKSLYTNVFFSTFLFGCVAIFLISNKCLLFLFTNIHFILCVFIPSNPSSYILHSIPHCNFIP